MIILKVNPFQKSYFFIKKINFGDSYTSFVKKVIFTSLAPFTFSLMYICLPKIRSYIGIIEGTANKF